MPRYKVKKPGFWEGRTYSPTGKRSVVHTDKPFPQDKKTKKEAVPSWMERLPEESAADAKKRKAAEAKAQKAAKTKAQDDREEIENFHTLGDGESATIETL